MKATDTVNTLGANAQKLIKAQEALRKAASASETPLADLLRLPKDDPLLRSLADEAERHRKLLQAAWPGQLGIGGDTIRPWLNSRII